LDRRLATTVSHAPSERRKERIVTIDLYKDRGTPVEQQKFTWRDLVRVPYSKLDVDAFTRIRIILMNGIESDAVRFSHVMSRMLNTDLRREMARIRRIEHHQQTMVNWLNPADQSPLETTIGYEQVAVEVTAAVALAEPDSYQAQAYRFGLLEDFDHMYRYSALMDRVEGKDANNIIQSYTDVIPGRPTSLEHRHPDDDVRVHYDKDDAELITKLHALTILSGEFQTHDYYMNIGPTFADPMARQLYAEIASIEEQHVTHYGSLADPNETPLEKWLLHQATEVYNYWSCVESEENPDIKRIWERFLDYELGHFQYVAQLFQRYERRDPAQIVPGRLPQPIAYVSHRDYVRRVLIAERDLSARDTQFVPRDQEAQRTIEYREQLNCDGSPSDAVAADYCWHPGTELTAIDGGEVELPDTIADEKPWRTI
jgi:hypothetical protein